MPEVDEKPKTIQQKITRPRYSYNPIIPSSSKSYNSTRIIDYKDNGKTKVKLRIAILALLLSILFNYLMWTEANNANNIAEEANKAAKEANEIAEKANRKADVAIKISNESNKIARNALKVSRILINLSNESNKIAKDANILEQKKINQTEGMNHQYQKIFRLEDLREKLDFLDRRLIQRKRNANYIYYIRKDLSLALGYSELARDIYFGPPPIGTIKTITIDEYNVSYPDEILSCDNLTVEERKICMLEILIDKAYFYEQRTSYPTHLLASPDDPMSANIVLLVSFLLASAMVILYRKLRQKSRDCN